MNTFRTALILCLLAMAGCGGSTTAPPVIYITISPLNASVAIGNTLQFTETTSGSAITDVAWQVNGIAGGNSTYGTISATGLYTAPATVPDPGTVVVTVVSLANTTYIANANVTIVSGIAVSVSPALANLGLGQTQQFTAAVTGNTNAGVTWKAGGVTGGNAASGTITAGGLYTAPATATTPFGVTITATSLVDPSKSGTATVAVHGGVAVSLEPNPVTVLTNHTVQFVPTISGTANTGLTWQVNGTNGGGPAIGTISAGGLYLAPRSVPTQAVNGTSQVAAVTVTAVSQADATASGSVVVTIVSPNQSAQALPISLGVSGGNALDSSAGGGCCGGTLGALLFRGGNYYILGSNHVLARTDQASAGEAILQPGLMDSNCAPEGTATVANLSQFSNLENPAPGTPAVDAAMALVEPGKVKLSGSILQLGDSLEEGQPADGSPHAGSGVSAAYGQAVAKSGRSTGLTCAAITAIHLTANVVFSKSCGSEATLTATLEDLVVVGGGSFSAEGDSGSLVVTQDTADPVAVVVGGSDSDTIAQPVSDVLAALRDPSSGEAPVFVGSMDPHPVAACTLPQFQTASTAPSSPAPIAPESLELAASVRSARGAALAESYGLDAVGVGPSLDQPGEAAILFFVSEARLPARIPQTVDGIRTRLVRLSRAPASLIASAAESTALLENATGAATPVSSASLASAVAAGKATANSLLAGPGILGVGVGASADSPEEAVLVVYVARAKPHRAVPAVVGSVRTQIRETNGFRAGSGEFRPRSSCQAKTRQKQIPLNSLTRP